MSIEQVTHERLKSISPVLDVIKSQAEDLKRLAEANDINIIIVIAEQKEHEEGKVAMCQLGHVNTKTELNALMALAQNMDKAKDIVEAKTMKKMVDLMDAGKLDIKLSKEEIEKLETIKEFFTSMNIKEE